MNLTLKTISEESFSEWQTEVSNFFSAQEKEFLDERWGGSGRAGGFFGACFGFQMKGDAYHYKDKTKDTFTASTEKQKGFAKSVYDLQSADFNVTGTVKATGTSRIPTTCRIFF